MVRIIKKYKARVFWIKYDNGVEDEINRILNELQESVSDFELVSVSSCPAPIILDETETITNADGSQEEKYKYALDNCDEYCVTISYRYAKIE